MSSKEFQEKVQFFPEQVKWLREMFPHRVLPFDATEAELRDYFGQQRVLAVIEQRVK